MSTLNIAVIPGDGIEREVIPVGVVRVLANGSHMTPDMGGNASTVEIGEAIANAI